MRMLQKYYNLPKKDLILFLKLKIKQKKILNKMNRTNSVFMKYNNMIKLNIKRKMVHILKANMQLLIK